MQAVLKFFDVYKRPFVLSVFLGLGAAFVMGDSAAGITIGLLTSIIFMFAEHFALVERLRTYIDMHRELVDSDKEVTALAIALRDIKLKCPGLAEEIAKESVTQLNRELVTLCSSQWTVRSFDDFVGIAAKLFSRSVKQQYCGTSVVRDYAEYWKSGPVRRFDQATTDAMKRGVSIKRVFICPTRDEVDRVLPVMEAQRATGIEVRYLLEEDIPHGLSCVDFGVWDRDVAVELTESRNRGVDFRATFHLTCDGAARFANMFDAMFHAGTPLERPGSRGEAG